MRVLLVSNAYTAGPGGAETVVAATAGLLEGAGHEVVPFAVRQPGTLPTPWEESFPVPGGSRWSGGLREAAAGVYSPTARRALERLVDRVRPDVAHVHHVFERLTLSVLDGLRHRGVPTVMTLHDYKPVCPNYRLFTDGRPCERCLGGRYVNVVRHGCLEGSRWRGVAAALDAYAGHLRSVYGAVDVFLAPSEFLRGRVVAGGLPAEDVVVVPNPAMPAAGPGPEATPATGASPGGRGRPVRFAYTGRLVPEKGLDVLLTAAGQLPAGVRVTVLGDGRAEEAVRRRVAAQRLPVDVLGRVGPSRVRAELATATATVLPALWYENCPMALLEAAAQGVPAVASRIGGIPEVVRDEVSGLLVPPGDPAALAAALRRLAADPALASRLGAAARDHVGRRHDPARHAAALSDCYVRAVSRHPRWRSGTGTAGGRRGRRR